VRQGPTLKLAQELPGLLNANVFNRPHDVSFVGSKCLEPVDWPGLRWVLLRGSTPRQHCSTVTKATALPRDASCIAWTRAPSTVANTAA
jgi:hypothetical protein